MYLPHRRSDIDTYNGLIAVIMKTSKTTAFLVAQIRPNLYKIVCSRLRALVKRIVGQIMIIGLL